MGDHFFLLMYATSGEERNVTRFTSYRRVEDAVAMVKEWLEKACCMDCYPAAEEAALREANGGQLPETAFLCPEVREPAGPWPSTMVSMTMRVWGCSTSS